MIMPTFRVGHPMDIDSWPIRSAIAYYYRYASSRTLPSVLWNIMSFLDENIFDD